MAAIKTPDYEKFVALSSDIHCVGELEPNRFTFVNAQWERTLGWSERESLEGSFLKFVHPEDQAATIEQIGRLQQGEQVVAFAIRCVHRDGSFRWLEWNVQMNGEEFYASARDVSERVAQEQESEKHKRLLEETMRLIHAGYYTINAQTQAMTWSKGMFAVYARAEELGVPSVEDAIACYHPEDRAKVAAYVRNSIEQQQSLEFEQRLIREDGVKRLVRAVGFPLLDEQGEMVSLFGMLRDLTDDPTTRREQDLERFAVMASHDLREPVRLIRLFLELIDKACDALKEQPAADYWARIIKASERMDVQIRDLNAFARSGQRFELRRTQTGPILEQLVEELRAQGHQVEVDEDLPVVWGDAARLREAFCQIVENAVQHGCHDGESLELKIEAKRRGAYVWLAFEDQGPGFESKYIDYVFQPFKRLDVRGTPGTGMGLSIARRTIEQCDGTLQASSSSGQGARFEVRLLAAD